MKRKFKKNMRKMYQSIIIFGFIILQSSQSVYGLEELGNIDINNINIVNNNSNDSLSFNSNNSSLRIHKNEFLNDSNELTEPEHKESERDHDKEPSYSSNFILNTILSTTSFSTTTPPIIVTTSASTSTTPSIEQTVSSTTTTEPPLIPTHQLTPPLSGIVIKTTTDIPESTMLDMSVEETTIKVVSARNLKLSEDKTNAERFVGNGSEDYNEDPMTDSQILGVEESNDTESMPSYDNTDDEESSYAEDTTIPNELDNEPMGDSSEEVINQTQTTITPTSTNKQIRVLKMSPDEILRNFVGDPNLRSPIAALVDRKQNPLTKAKQLWKASLRPNSPLDIILMAYDGEDIRENYNLNTTKALRATLDSMRETVVIDDKPSRTYFSILELAQKIPYDSAIFLSTDSLPKDLEYKQEAAMMLLKKRIRLYLIMFDEKTVEENDTSGQGETGALGELTLRTGGEIIHVPNTVFGPDGELGLITLVVRNGLQRQEETIIDVDRTMKSLKINIDGDMESSSLETPKGEVIDLQEPLSSDGSVLSIERKLENPEMVVWTALVDVTDQEGKYKLRTKSLNQNDFYSVIVKAEIAPEADDYTIDLSKYKVNDTYNQGGREHSIIQRQMQPESDDSMSDTAITSAKQQILETVTKIDVGAQSQLLVAPGSTAQIYFEITNLRKEPTFHNFQVQDELRYLRALEPRGMFLAPSETKQAMVTVTVPSNAQLGVKNKITFTSLGVTQVQQAVYLTVTSTGVQDPWQPHIWYTYGSRCEWRTAPGNCAGHIWSIEVVAQDHESGLMRIESNPKGLIYRGTFIAGTNQQVKATYSASCCEPRVTITAMDINRNQRTIQLDVSDIYLSDFGIAAVVLGILFFILLIILLVIWIRWCIRRRQQSRDLPSYRGAGDVRT